MIKEEMFVRILPEGRGVFVSDKRAVAPCGCTVFAGVRSPALEAATMVKGCSEHGNDLERRYNEAFEETLHNPSARPLVEVCEEVLRGTLGF